MNFPSLNCLFAVVMAGHPTLTSPSATTSPAAAQQTAWQYEQTTAPTGPTHRASLTASNLLQLAYPYAGGSMVTLTVRTRSGDTQAYLSVSKGMFAPSYTGGTAQIRVNNGAAATYTLSGAANGRANILFIDDTARLLRQLRTARTMVVQLAILNQKLNDLHFSTVPLRWNH